MRTTFTFHSASQLIFGRDAVLQLGEIVRQLSAERVFVVTDKALSKAGLAELVCRPLREVGLHIEVFDVGLPEPPIALAVSCAAQARSFGSQAILGLGGGSNMDLAKIVATILAHGGGPRDYVGDDQIPGPILTLVCVPTTAGTGSEVSGATVLTDT